MIICIHLGFLLTFAAIAVSTHGTNASGPFIQRALGSKPYFPARPRYSHGLGHSIRRATRAARTLALLKRSE